MSKAEISSQMSNSDTVLFFDARRMGENLKEVGVDVINAESESIVSRWYGSNQDINLYFWVDQKRNIIKQQMNFCGQHVEWNILDGVRTGVLIEEDQRQSDQLQETGPKEDGATLKGKVLYDETPIEASIRQAQELIHHAMDVPESERQHLLENFSQSPTLEQMGTDEFCRRFGTTLKDKKEKKSFWKKFMNWMD